MKTLMFVVCVPFLAVCTALPAQEDKAETKAKAKAAAAEKKVQEKITANDPAIRAIDEFIKKQSVSKKNPTWRTRLSAPPKQEFQANCDYFWHVETSAGLMKVRYLADSAPMHVTSGIYLARLGYYDGLNFHRIIPGFMAQGGCPTGTGTGGPGYYMDGEFKGGRMHDRPGLLSMANTGRPKSDGSQFFLTFVKTPHLNNRHTVWGEVVDGMATVKALEKLGSGANNGMLKNGPKIVRSWVSVVPKKAKAGKTGEHGKKGEKGGEHGGKQGA